MISSQDGESDSEIIRVPDDEDGKPTIDDIDLGDINVDPKAAKDETDD